MNKVESKLTEKKICILNHGLDSGGTDSFVINLASELVKKYDVTIVMAADNPSTQFRADEASKLGAHVVCTCGLGGGISKNQAYDKVI